DVIIPESIDGFTVTGIGDWAFAGCGLTSVTIPASITSIGNQAFSYCFSLTSANFMGNAPLTGASVFDYVGSGFTVYYSTDKADFTSPTWMGYPSVGVEPLHLPAGYMSWVDGYFPAVIDPAIINTTAQHESGHGCRELLPVQLPPHRTIRRHGHHCGCAVQPEPRGAMDQCHGWGGRSQGVGKSRLLRNWHRPGASLHPTWSQSPDLRTPACHSPVNAWISGARILCSREQKPRRLLYILVAAA
ncbi:MAG: leucine-rich repeat domain-containing protein, partial [Verrucomicrobia bacterium]|nr:leucine-rich repeat domain-containing protein [Verrucomicrobiota bacterium]